MTTRRQFLTGAAALICAPAIVRASSIMPIRAIEEPVFDAGTVRWSAAMDPNSWNLSDFNRFVIFNDAENPRIIASGHCEGGKTVYDYLAPGFVPDGD